ncbi:MAG: alanine--glyoxylate aminotransferase family protein [Puniceicoccales bacterium]|jgi:aspartate aminotransferase-like enzyme|nr:alanine--glyoxylate aminotransferase family protein [Puniceicoccales bacterium]
MSIRLYIPGPITVSDDTFRAMAQGMIGHRSKDFVALYQSLQPGLQKIAGTADPVYLSTSSSWGVMEGSLRNVTAKKVLCCMNGAFSDKWFDVAQRCGKEATALRFDWGKPVDPDAVRKELLTGQYDAITFIHSETSTGTLSPLADITAVVREFPDVISIVDTVSSFSTVPVSKDALGIDVLISGSQKALALPPGLALLSVSERARQRAATLTGRGYYFDFLEFQANHEKGMTPSTPAISLIYGLSHQLKRIEEEGIEARYARHLRLNEKVRSWGKRRGFQLFPEEKFGTRGLNCFANTRNVDLDAVNKALKSQFSSVIDGGYGKLKGKTFRISNMGDETDATIDTLIGALDSVFSANGA